MSGQLARLPASGSPVAIVVLPPGSLEATRRRNSLTVAQVIDTYLREQSQFFRGKNLGEMQRPLLSFAAFAGRKPVCDCNARDLAQWVAANPSWRSPHTKRYSMCRVAAAFQWAQEAQVIEWNPFVVPEQCRKHNPKPLPKFLKAAEIEQLLRCAEERIEIAKRGVKRYKLCTAKIRAAERDLMVMRLGLWLGLRMGDIVGLRVEDVDLDARTLFINCGKGGKDAVLPVSLKLAAALKAWIGDRKSGVLIARDNGEEMSYKTMHWRCVRLGRLAGLPRHLHMHILRHSAACQMLAKGVDVRSVMELLRHNDLATTSRYLHCDPQRLRDAVERL